LNFNTSAGGFHLKNQALALRLLSSKPATVLSPVGSFGGKLLFLPFIVAFPMVRSVVGLRIRGQAHVIPRVVSVLQRGELGLTKPTRPRGSFMFLGPTGVGKTEITLAFTEFLFGADKLFRFDMSEYQTQESLGVLLGARLGERGTLGMAYDKSPCGTLLFDEIEKAHPRVLDVSCKSWTRRG
jgi:hypothetical protein